ncbi:AlpA family phage regulatory protein [Paracoccaceae bacterium]|nr:AlpA family phage regulatory protein [Paracoccaceae bacterium]
MQNSKSGLATDQHLAHHLNCSRSQVWALAKKTPNFPKPIRITGGMTRWRWADVAAWENSLETQ